MSEQQSTMRDLLARWAVVEPERCRPKEQIKGFTVHSGEVWDFMLLENLATEESQMRIQWAVQQAITARGWPFELEWDGEWLAKVKNNLCSHTDLNNPAAALLGGYLQALEANKKAG